MTRRIPLRTVLVLLLLAASIPATAADWPNSGGNAGRNCLTTETGPTAEDVLWTGGRSSLIAWQPVTEGNRVFMIRQLRWPNQQPGDSPVIAMDLTTGGELWARDLPYNTGDWTAWIAGARDGRVYASRSGNGASVSAYLYALDAASGGTIWVSQDQIDAGPYDGVVFTPEGDLLVASFQDIWRIRRTDGTTAWHAVHTGSVSGTCGGALYGNSFYVADAVYGGHVLVRFDAVTGARLYQSPIMAGFTLQNTPMVGPDGTIYLNRTQNNVAVDFLYAFTDTGTQFVEKWHVPTASNTAAELAVGIDGSVYAVIPGPILARLDPDDGSIMNSTPLASISSSRFAIDAAGKVFFSNGDFAGGRFFSFNADLTPRWSTAVANINIGGPALGAQGTLVICGVGTDIRAYRSQDPADVVAQIPPAAGRLTCFPNPFREGTTISFNLPRGGAASLEVFDAAGHRVRSLLQGEPLPPGTVEVRWDGRGADGPLPSGAYYFRLTSPGQNGSGRVLLTR